MLLKHVALICSSEDKSDRFYKELLELRKMSSKALPGTLAKQIFNLDAEYKIINYAGQSIQFEIFIGRQETNNFNKIEHVCLQVADLQTFLKKCRDLEVDVSQIPKGDRYLTFIRDYDGNIFEIKS